MVAPVTVKVEKGLGGKVEISEGEYTSEGFETNGLKMNKRYPAAIACWLTCPEPTTRDSKGNSVYAGSYVEATYLKEIPQGDPYDIKWNCNPVVNNTDGSIVGYKYFNLDGVKGNKARLLLNMKTTGVKGNIKVMVDSPWESCGGKCVGQLSLSGKSTKAKDVSISLKGLQGMSGKHALFFVFSSPTKKQSLCTLYSLSLNK